MAKNVQPCKKKREEMGPATIVDHVIQRRSIFTKYFNLRLNGKVLLIAYYSIRTSNLHSTYREYGKTLRNFIMKTR